MKKLFVALSIVLMIFGLCACHPTLILNSTPSSESSSSSYSNSFTLTVQESIDFSKGVALYEASASISNPNPDVSYEIWWFVDGVKYTREVSPEDFFDTFEVKIRTGIQNIQVVAVEMIGDREIFKTPLQTFKLSISDL